MSQPTSQSIFARHALPIMAVVVASIPLVVMGVKEAFERQNNNVSQWLPEDFKQTTDYEDFREMFGADDFAMVGWEGCTLDDKDRLELFARKLVPPPDLRREGDHSRWFDKVITGPRAIETLTDEPFNLTYDEAIDRIKGTLIGPDGYSCCALVSLSKVGDTDRTGAVDAMREVAVTQCGIDPDDLRLAGDVVTNAVIDIESQKAIQQFIVLSWIISLAAAWWCLRSPKLMMFIFVVAGYCSLISTAIIFYTGGTMNLVLVVVPVLIYVLPLSAAVHLANYYRDAIRESGLEGAPVRAMRAGWTPCALSALTTALGLISLYVSHIRPIKMFGVYSAAGILLSLVFLFVLLPVLMETWPLRAKSGTTRRGQDSQDRLLKAMADWIIHHRKSVVTICLGLLVSLAAGVVYIQTTVAPSRFFSPDSRWLRDGVWLQDHMGPAVPFEIVLRIDVGGQPGQMNFLERMQLVNDVEQAIRRDPMIGGTISAATFQPSWNAAGGASGSAVKPGRTGRALIRALGLGDPDSIRRRIINRRLEKYRDHFVKTNYLYVSPPTGENGHGGETERWRISARAQGLEGADYGRLLQGVENRVDRFLLKRVPAENSVQPTYTGVIPLVFVAQNELLNGLVKSFCLAFAMIAVLMVFLLRSLWAGLLVMLPNMFPAATVFGVMGWTGALVDVGAMMTASVALGIAVDDTLHFLTWFRRALGRGMARRQAIHEAYLRCAPAMTQTTLIAGLGLVVFGLSSFQPVAQFGLLMFILLTAALVGDLILLPAMLATRMGKLFEGTSPDKTKEPPTAETQTESLLSSAQQ